MMQDSESGNLFDNTAPVYKRWINGDTYWSYSGDSTSYTVPVKPGHTYLISGYPLDMTVYRIGIYNDELPSESDTRAYTLTQVARETSSAAFGTTRTITAGAGAKYLILQFNAARKQNILDNLTVTKV